MCKILGEKKMFVSKSREPNRFLGGGGGVGITKSESLSVLLRRRAPGLREQSFLTLPDILILHNYSV